jgi:hypothetical protein
MPLPTPNRNLPDTLDTGPPGPTGGAYADKVAAEVERIWDLVPNPLINIGGSANAITAECSPPLIKDITHGQPFWLIPAANNTLGVTVDIDSRGAVEVLTYDGLPLEADDLVAGEGVELRGYIAGSPETTFLRLPHPTARQLIAIASVGGDQLWEHIGDSGSVGSLTQIEFTFTAGRYSRVAVVADLTLDAGVSRQVQCTLRHSGGAIVTLNSTQTNSANPRPYNIDFVITSIPATKQHFGTMDGYTGAAMESAPIRAAGANATAPDRVRINSINGTITAGRVMAYGLLATAP